jgi:spoIIIJ-associated protein
MAKNENKAQEIVDGFLKMLSVDAKAKVFTVEEYLKIEIDGKDSSLLIGFHGDNLQAIRHLLSIVLRRELGPETRVTVDVAGYLEKKEERIQVMAQRAIDKFEATGRPQELRDLSPFERRMAHSYLTEKGYKSESAGEGYDRHIVISK